MTTLKKEKVALTRGLRRKARKNKKGEGKTCCQSNVKEKRKEGQKEGKSRPRPRRFPKERNCKKTSKNLRPGIACQKGCGRQKEKAQRSSGGRKLMRKKKKNARLALGRNRGGGLTETNGGQVI